MRYIVIFLFMVVFVGACNIAPNSEYVVDEINTSKTEGMCFVEFKLTPQSMYIPCDKAPMAGSSIQFIVKPFVSESEDTP